MKTITYSAPGKVILSGEHAVVYGKPAFVSAINLRLTVMVRPAEENQEGKPGEVITAVKQFITASGVMLRDHSCWLEIASDIPVGRGLGSSAALSVAASAALYEYLTGQRPSEEIINNCAYRVEKLFHANPSGVDTTAACYGGLIFFRKEFDFLKTISKLNMKIPSAFADKLLLIDSGKPEESTAEMVQNVGKRYNRSAKRTDAALGRIEKCTKRLVVASIAENHQLFSQCISDNQRELEELGVVSARTRDLLTELKPWGAGKVTGAGGRKGGSGYLLYFAHDPVAIKEYLDNKKISYLSFSPSLAGVRKEV